MVRDELTDLAAAGYSLREIAERLGVSVTVAQRQLGDAGLRTVRSKQRRAALQARDLGLDEAEVECPTHGMTRHRRRPRGSYVCLRCRSESVARRRRKVKAILVAEAGGACKLCGYDRHAGALQFHHRDPSQKSFSLSAQGVTRSLARARQEAQKCVLLCANCHAEVEAGLQQIA